MSMMWNEGCNLGLEQNIYTWFGSWLLFVCLIKQIIEHKVFKTGLYKELDMKGIISGGWGDIQIIYL